MLNFPLPVETSRLVLRDITIADKKAFSTVQFENGVDGFIDARLTAQRKIPRIECGLAVVEKQHNDVIGYAELAINEIDDIELRCFIFPEYQSQGYATEACMALSSEVFNVEYEFMTATTSPADLAAHIVLKKLGMVIIGKNDDQQEYWSLERKDFLAARNIWQKARQIVAV
jgi:RimJ/RimL family protein N-acetyltransferase